MKKILEVEDLTIHFTLYNEKVHALRDINFHLFEKETLGIVGESGCGKSVLTQSLVKLLPSPPVQYVKGKIFFQKTNLLTQPTKKLCPYRGNEIAYIFQNPMTSLNPTIKIGKQILEAIKKDRSKEKVIKLLKAVEIKNPEERFHQYPHELSGGQKQRIMIAIAIAMNPKILIADEPTTALDITIQAQIMSLLMKIQKKMNMSIIFISHDLKLVSNISDRILVIYGGEIMEEGSSEDIINHPKHPYTKLLLQSIPSIEDQKEQLTTIIGTPPDLIKIEEKCIFSDRCPYAQKICFQKKPKYYFFKKNQKAACWLYKEEK
ncbi:MAG: hypothetical protein AMS24_04300 [Chlamydiae bacterium SM23_39]|nr:MAG: hypothetical protein AMS24_04300 [Chlamydiae bacterium SM23_39]